MTKVIRIAALQPGMTSFFCIASTLAEWFQKVLWPSPTLTAL